MHAPPRSVTGQPLPEARLLSRIFLPPGRRDDDIWTLATMQWGQIVTHDMSLGMATLPNPNGKWSIDVTLGKKAVSFNGLDGNLGVEVLETD